MELSPGDDGVSGTVGIDESSYTVPDNVYAMYGGGSINIPEATTITFFITPGPRRSDFRITFRVYGISNIVFRYISADDESSNPVQVFMTLYV